MNDQTIVNSWVNLGIVQPSYVQAKRAREAHRLLEHLPMGLQAATTSDLEAALDSMGGSYFQQLSRLEDTQLLFDYAQDCGYIRDNVAVAVSLPKRSSLASMAIRGGGLVMMAIVYLILVPVMLPVALWEWGAWRD